MLQCFQGVRETLSSKLCIYVLALSFETTFASPFNIAMYIVLILLTPYIK